MSLKKCYTGIGSRSTPIPVLRKMFALAKQMAKNGYILRSGGAEGADLAFEWGCDKVGGAKEIYLPWQGFNESDSDLHDVSSDAMYIASTIHPAWNKLSQGAQRLHGRNVYQVLGLGLNFKSEALYVWTPNSVPVGGSRTAIILAERYGIPITYIQ